MKLFILCILLLIIPLSAIAKPYKAPNQVLVGTEVVNQPVDTQLTYVNQPAQPSVNKKPGCEQYRDVVEKYFGPETDTALFVASKESGCRMDAISSTHDYCLFQINREPQTLTDLDLCVRRAHDKYVGGRVGENNWSAWYAVCSPAAVPKYPGIDCN